MQFTLCYFNSVWYCVCLFFNVSVYVSIVSDDEGHYYTGYLVTYRQFHQYRSVCYD